MLGGAGFICREVEGGGRAVGALGGQHEVTLEEWRELLEGVEPEWAGLGGWPRALQGWDAPLRAMRQPSGLPPLPSMVLSSL